MRITVIAHKGGAGKTTVTANLGAACAAAGRRVLLVDCDPQGSLGVALGVAADKPGLYDALVGRASVADAVRPVAMQGLALLPADSELAGAEAELSGRARWYLTLRRLLEALNGYDLMLLDAPPGLGALSFLALQAGTHALLVCPPDFLALRALDQVLATVERARGITPDLRVLGIVPTLVTRRSRHEREVLDALHERHGGLLMPEIPRRVAVQDAAAAGRPVTIHAPRNDAAAAFAALAQEVLRRAEPRPAVRQT